MTIHQFFLERARISRKSLARFAEQSAREIDRIADGLGHGALVTLDEAREILTELDAGDPNDEEAVDLDDEETEDDDESDEEHES
jgi:hypothetical protein